MAETIRVRVSLDFEVDKSSTTKDGATTIEFVEQSLGEVVRHYAKLTSDPKYLGPKVIVSVPQGQSKVVAEE
jgi:hypothetical protein